MEMKKMPVHTVKLGKIQASVWRNETKQGPRFNVTMARLYLENGEWKRSDSFGRDELLAVAKALETAYFWIWSHPATDDKGDASGAAIEL
ncbi:MAG: hypothetical protein AB9869_03735 [Verrucomicrobiia bacterium]